MKGSVSVLITVVVVIIAAGLYMFVAKPKLDAKRQALEAKITEQKAQLAQIEQYKIDKEEMKKLLPRWKEQFEVFRQAIPVNMDDDVFLRNLGEQLRANGVELMSVELTPSGQWFPNLNETEEANYAKEHVKAEELRKVKVANFSVSLLGDFGDVLRAFENLKLYGRIYALDRIVGPSGGAGGAVFQNEDPSTTPILVSGRIFYGLSESYLSQETLDTYFGRAEALGAASAIYESATRRADELSANPAAEPAPPAPGSAPAPTPPAGGTETPAATEGATDSAATSAKLNNNQRIAASTKPAARRMQAAGG